MYYFNYQANFSNAARRALTRPLTEAFNMKQALTHSPPFTKADHDLQNSIKIHNIHNSPFSEIGLKAAVRRARQARDLQMVGDSVIDADMDFPGIKFKNMAKKHNKPVDKIYESALRLYDNDIHRFPNLRKAKSGEVVPRPESYQEIIPMHPNYTDIRKDPTPNSKYYLGFPKVNGYMEVPIDPKDLPTKTVRRKPRILY